MLIGWPIRLSFGLPPSPVPRSTLRLAALYSRASIQRLEPLTEYNRIRAGTTLELHRETVDVQICRMIAPAGVSLAFDATGKLISGFSHFEADAPMEQHPHCVC